MQCSWKTANNHLSSIFSFRNNLKKTVTINTGKFNDLEQLTNLRQLVKNMSKWMSIIINNEKNYSADFQNNYLIKNNIFEISTPKVILLVGINLKYDNPILNIHLNKLRKLHITNSENLTINLKLDQII